MRPPLREVSDIGIPSEVFTNLRIYEFDCGIDYFPQ
jgi:hypothetical protein